MNKNNSCTCKVLTLIITCSDTVCKVTLFNRVAMTQKWPQNIFLLLLSSFPLMILLQKWDQPQSHLAKTLQIFIYLYIYICIYKYPFMSNKLGAASQCFFGAERYQKRGKRKPQKRKGKWKNWYKIPHYCNPIFASLFKKRKSKIMLHTCN